WSQYPPKDAGSGSARTVAPSCGRPRPKGDAGDLNKSGHEGSGYRDASRSCEIPAAILRPSGACTLRGCSTIEFCEPPSRALAPTPSPTVASAPTPAYVPMSDREG